MFGSSCYHLAPYSEFDPRVKGTFAKTKSTNRCTPEKGRGPQDALAASAPG
jgi:hypothetical protein